MRFRFAVLAALAVLPLAFAACGGGDDTTGGGGGSDLSSADQDQISKAVEFAAVSGDPKACTEAQTLKFTEQTSGGTGQAAVKSCEKDAENTAADSVTVTNIEGDSDSATADANFTGNVFDGQTIEIALVKEGGAWKLDEALGFKDFDRDKLLAGIEKSLATEGGGAPQSAIDCVTKNLDALSDEQLQSIFINNDQQLLEQAFGPCFQ